jgi:hypothetical protein
MATAADWPQIQALREAHYVRYPKTLVPVPENALWWVVGEERILAACAAVFVTAPQALALVSDLYCVDGPAGARGVSAIISAFNALKAKGFRTMTIVPQDNLSMIKALYKHGFHGSAVVVEN